MKKTFQKLTKISIGTLLLTVLLFTVAFATTYYDKYVYGNSYTVVASGKSTDNGANFLTVAITDIYKSDGSESDYKKIKSDVLDGNGNQISLNTDVILNLGTADTIILKQNYSSGTSMKLRMKGNVSTLDCIVTFTAALN